MGFSSILDISSFFIGMIINLIFVALMCYYFKRKYDYLYEAQCEQSKIIYQLLHKPIQPIPSTPGPSMDFTCDPLVKANSVHSTCLNEKHSDRDSDNESDESDDESVGESENELEVDTLNAVNKNANEEVLVLEEFEPEIRMISLKTVDTSSDHPTLSIEEIKEEPLELTLNLEADMTETTETNYSKMSMKQLKEVLSSKGIKPKTNIKKEELIELITKDSS
jgi:hypothetical protein